MLAGALSGLVVLAGFIVVHTLTIGFFLNFFIEGPPVVMLAGALAGRGYHALRAQMPHGVVGGVAYSAMVWGPAALLAGGAWLFARPLPLELLQRAGAIAVVVLTLALASWLVRRRFGRAPARAYALAALIPTLFLGGNAVAGGGVGRGAFLAPGAAAAALLAGVALALLDARLRARFAARTN